MESQSCIELCNIWEMALPPGEKLILLALAEVGNSPGVPALAAATGYSQRQVRRLLASLVARGALREQDAPAGKAKHYVTPDILSPLTPEADPGHAVTPDRQVRTHTHVRARDSVVESLVPQDSLGFGSQKKETTTGDVRPDTMSGEAHEVIQLALSLPLMAEDTARRLVKLHGVERVRAVVGYAATYAGKLSNPAGFVVAKLAQGWSPPQEPDPLAGLRDGKRYTAGKFAHLIEH